MGESNYQIKVLKRVLRIYLLLNIYLFNIEYTSAQSYNDGPIDLEIKLREVQGNFAATDEALLGVGFAPDELTFKIWAQDNLGTYPWTGGACLQDNNFTPTLGGTNSIDFNTIFANFSFNTNIVPQYLDLKIDAWEDDLPSDGLLGFCSSGTSCTWQDMECCGVYLFGICVGVETGDDYRCEATPFYQGLTYRSGPPCIWYSHGYINGSGCVNPSSQPNAPNTDGYYKPHIETYWRYTKGTSFMNAINLGNINSGLISHFNSNECYTDYYISSSGNDVIYSFTVTNPTGVNISLCGINGAQFDSYLYLVYDTNSVPIAYNDNTCANQSEITTALCDTGTYYVVVDGTSSSELGTFTLTITEDISSSFVSNISSLDPSCNGSSNGKIFSAISGGEGPYTFYWYDSTMNLLTIPNTTFNLSDSLINIPSGGYILQISDNNNCILSDSVTINQPGIMLSSISTIDPSCSGYLDGSANVNISGGTPPYMYYWNTNPIQNSSSAISLGAGTYTLTINDFNQCDDSVSVTINDPSQVPVHIVNSSNIVCPGGSIDLFASGALSYSWSPSIWLNTTTGFSVSSTPNSSIMYIVTGTDINGCSNTDTIDIIVTTSLSTLVSPPSPIGCSGEDIIVSLSSSSNVTYSWTPSFGVTEIPTPLGSDFIIVSQYSQSYDVLVTDMHGCMDSLTIPVSILPKPNISVTDPGLICRGSSASLNASGANIYYWFPNIFLSDTIGSVVTAYPSSSTIYYTVGFATNGCSDTAITTVNIVPNPIINMLPQSATICKGDTTSIFLTGASSYVWSPNLAINNSNIDSVLVFPVSNTDYIISGIDSLGCSSDTIFQVFVNSNPVISASTSYDTICLNESTILSVSGASLYYWEPSLSLNTNIGEVVSAMPTSDITYTVFGVDTNNCSSSDTIKIVVNQLPLLSINTNDTTICEGEDIQLHVLGASSYLWSPALGLNFTTNDTVLASPTTTSNYFITGTDSNGCSDIIETKINVNPSPEIGVFPNIVSMCEGAIFTANSFGASSYIWSPNYGLSDTIGSTILVNPASSIIYTISGIDINNCTNSTTLEVNVGIPPNISISPSSPIICEGESITLLADGAYSYHWLNDTSLSSSIGHVVVANPIVTTNYIIVGTDTLNCLDTTEVTVSVIPRPTADISNNSGGVICSGDSSLISINLGGNPPWNIFYSINGSTNQIITVDNPHNIESDISGTYVINSVIDSNGCSNIGTGVASINVVPNPIANFIATPQPTNILDSKVTFFNSSLFTDSCYWEFGDFTTSYEFSPSKSYNSSGTYTVNLIAWNNNMCSDIISKNIIINPIYTLYIPDTFSPSNLDGLNDVFLVKGLEDGIQDFQMYIYNRWGQEVFYSNNINNGWNGLDVAQHKLPTGLYSYIIYLDDYSGIPHKIKGEILLQ